MSVMCARGADRSIRLPLRPVAGHIISHEQTCPWITLVVIESNGRGPPHPEVKGYNHELLQTLLHGLMGGMEWDGLWRRQKVRVCVYNSMWMAVHIYTICRMSDLSVTGRQWVPLAAMFLCRSSEVSFCQLVRSVTHSLSEGCFIYERIGKVTLECVEVWNVD